MKEQRTLNRLPGYDQHTARAEFAVFASMAILGLMLIGNAALRSMDFASDRGAIIQALEQPETVIVKAPARHVPTNIAATLPARKQKPS